MHIADAELHQRSFSTTKGYIEKHILPRWGRIRITDIDTRAVAQWLASKRDEGLAPATVIKIKAILGGSFELGARWSVPGCDGKNPVRAVQPKPANNARERYVTAEEAARLIAAAGQSRNKVLAPIVSLLLYTGMRVSELLSMRWEHVDLTQRIFYLPTSKTSRSRYVPLAQAAIEVVGSLPRPKGAVFLFSNTKDPMKQFHVPPRGRASFGRPSSIMRPAADRSSAA